MKRTNTNDLIEELSKLAKDLKGFGADERIISEAADRLKKQQRKIRNQRREIEALAKDKHRVDGFVNWLNAEIRKCWIQPTLSTDFIHEKILQTAKKQLEKLRNGLGEK
jgi:hypothetical protein